jgi:Glycosyl hydrolases family 18
MTHERAEQFLQLVVGLKEAMPNKIISVTLLSDPAYLNGTRNGQYGFPSSILKSVVDNSTYMNLMTYDFYGAFNYPGITGFLTNLHDASPTLFSIEASVQAALNAGVNPSHLSVGIPSYGRALTGIDSNNAGLFQPIPSSSTIPRGNLDSANCSTDITAIGASSCSGSFQYRYIIDNMLGKGLTATEHEQVGTTAYGASFKPPSGHELNIQSNGSTIGFNVTIGSFKPGDFFNTNDQHSYDGAITGIDGEKNLTVSWATNWGNPTTDPKGSCKETFSFTQSMNVSIQVVGDNSKPGTYLTTCTYTNLSQ